MYCSFLKKFIYTKNLVDIEEKLIKFTEFSKENFRT